MKILKFFLFLFLICNINICYAEKFKIEAVNFNITGSDLPFSGKTQVYSLQQNVNINTDFIFSNEEDFTEYLADVKRQLENLRAFDFIEINFITIETHADLNLLELTLTLKDSNHLLALPYPKYDSNEGINFKLKAKDTNFLGTLNELEYELFLTYPFDSDNNKKQIGSKLTYDYPFKLGSFNATWINDYSFSYIFNDNSPEWNLKSGLKLSYPINNYFIDFEIYQKAVKNSKFKIYDDEIYFSENGILSFPIKLFNFTYLGNLTYCPYFNTEINWDKNSINKLNTELSGPVFSLGHTLSAERIDWINNLRIGLSFNLLNEIKYNYQRNIIYPSISFENNSFYFFTLNDSKIFNKIGICQRFYAFNCFINKNNPYFYSDGNPIGEYLRGIRDEQYYTNTNIKSLSTISSIILNLDFPFSIITTSFSTGILRYFNFNLQISPFIDIALTHNKITEKYYSLKDGFYSGGVEVLVYPLKWSSFTVRGSLGIDLGRTILKHYLNTDWRGTSSTYEISFGIGLQY